MNNLLTFFKKKIAILVGMRPEDIDSEVIHDLREKEKSDEELETLEEKNMKFLAQFKKE